MEECIKLPIIAVLQADLRAGLWEEHRIRVTLSREILDITGITIQETSKPGKGARFEMIVPKGAYRFSDVQQ